MKKYVALIMVMVLAFSLSMTAFAAPAEVTGEFKLANVWLDKTNTQLTEGNYPDIELSFDVLPISAEKYSYAAYADPNAIPVVEVVKPVGSSDFVLSGTDAIEGVGIFSYRMWMNDPAVSGVTADNDAYTLKFLVSYKESETEPGVFTTEREVSQFDIRNSEDEKVDTIFNTYTVSNVTLDKEVTGNLSNGEDKFDIKVFFGSARPVLTDIVMPDGTKAVLTQDAPGSMYLSDTYTVEICANDDIKTITGVPADVTVYISEVDPDPYTLVGYTVDGVSSSDVAFGATASDTDVVVVNEYKTNIDTGISLDSLPYILVLAAVGGGLVYFFIRRRQNAFDAD